MTDSKTQPYTPTGWVKDASDYGWMDKKGTITSPSKALAYIQSESQPVDLTAVDDKGYNLLMRTVKNVKKGKVSSVLVNEFIDRHKKEGVDVGLWSEHRKKGNAMLMVAEYGDFSTAHKLLEIDPGKVNECDASGRTLLYYAARRNDPSEFIDLLNKGAEIFKSDYPELLRLAVEDGQAGQGDNVLKVVKMLLCQDNRIERQLNSKFKFDTIKQQCIDAEARSGDAQTVLDLAETKGYSEVCTFLKSVGFQTALEIKQSRQVTMNITMGKSLELQRERQ